ncbi:hypothetical protein [Homoserinibacter sp. YIM 151385]|uniref:hypothetical protein n=1 Tax=Homoserinibacter sp. YIM 151385 TaxID=2985506 RepID=UPI0022F1390D|nr:hypothetical protein [Homoserinibacter sp. YIM 151385]WBU38010.1 hypothetical protein OF852_00025 [Homoserinibacter sp. YIM 151385]
MTSGEGEHPELAGYEPGDGRPLRHPAVIHIMRVVVVLAIAGLILPMVSSSISTNISTANAACRIVVAQEAPDRAPDVRFELFQPDGPGWYCYAVGFGDDETLVRWLGLIPEIQVRPAGGVDV